MAKQNVVFLLARIPKRPSVAKGTASGNLMHGMGYVHVVRGFRDARDGVKYIKHDYPLILTKDEEIMNQMLEWRQNDIVLIKGVLVSKDIIKESRCTNPECKDPDGKGGTKNSFKGTVLFINPIWTMKIQSFGESPKEKQLDENGREKPDENKKAAIKFLVDNRELSNQAYFIGTVVKEPTLFKTKKGTTVGQYQVCINRKYHIRSDDPSIRRDWPYIKSYGDQAIEDKLRLKLGTDVYIDGFVQARRITRRIKCKCCGKIYTWPDHAMEIVPFAVEYGKGTYRTDKDIAAEKKASVEDLRQQLFDGLIKDKVTKEEKENISDDIDKSSVDDADEDENDKKNK